MENKIEDKAESRIEWLEEKFQEAVWNRLLMLARWLVFAALTGIVLGLVGTAFGKEWSWRRLSGQSISG